MNIQFTFKNLNDVIKPEVEEYASSRLEGLVEKYYADLPEDAVIVRMTIESLDKRTVFKGATTIEVRHGNSPTFTALEAKHTYTEVIDNMKDMLAKQIREDREREKDKSRKSSLKHMQEEVEAF